MKVATINKKNTNNLHTMKYPVPRCNALLLQIFLNWAIARHEAIRQHANQRKKLLVVHSV